MDIESIFPPYYPEWWGELWALWLLFGLVLLILCCAFLVTKWYIKRKRSDEKCQRTTKR